MAVLIAGGGNRKQEGEAAIWIDTITSIDPVFSSVITQHPVESNSSITDHRYRVNPVFAIEGYISGHPHYGENPFTDNLVDANLSNPPTTLSTGNPFTPSNPRVQAAYDILKAANESNEPLTLVTELERYDNCLITRLSLPQSVAMSESLHVSITLEQVRLVTTEEVTLVQVAPSKQDNAAANEANGNGVKQDPSNEFQKALDAYAVLRTGGEAQTFSQYKALLEAGATFN